MHLVPEGHCNVSRGGAIPGAAAEGAAQRADAISCPRLLQCPVGRIALQMAASV